MINSFVSWFFLFIHINYSNLFDYTGCITRSSSSQLKPIIENSEAIIREARRTRSKMEGNKLTLDSYLQPHHIPLCNAIRLPMGLKFELKPNILQLLTTRLQFGGFTSKNPLEHLSEFTSLCEGLSGGSTPKITMLTLFLYPLRHGSCNFQLVQLLHGTS